MNTPRFIHLHDSCEATSVIINVEQISVVEAAVDGSTVTLLNNDCVDVQEDVDTIIEAIHNVLGNGYVIA